MIITTRLSSWGHRSIIVAALALLLGGTLRAQAMDTVESNQVVYAGGPINGGTGNVIAIRDDFNHHVTVTLHGMFANIFEVSGYRPVSAPRESELVFTITAPSWRYLSCYNADFLADTTLVQLRGPSTHDGHVAAEGVLESITVPITPEAIRTLATAHVAKGRICNTEFTFTPAQQEKLGLLAGKPTRGDVHLPTAPRRATHRA